MMNSYLTARKQARSDVELSVDELIGMLERFALVSTLIKL